METGPFWLFTDSQIERGQVKMVIDSVGQKKRVQCWQGGWSHPAVFALVALGASLSAFAQDVRVEETGSRRPVESAEAPVERISVTGSHIKRIDMEGTSPITVIDSEVFENSGNVTLEDVFRDSPYFESVSESPGREGYIRFRGQHAGNTLILLNGMRLPKEEGRFFTSIAYLPTSAIDRIEIMRDGGSATYGSDAMAGVINFITKKNASGGQVSTSVTARDDGAGLERNLQGNFGGSVGRSTYLVGIQYRTQDPLSERDLGSRYQSFPRDVSSSGVPRSVQFSTSSKEKGVFGNSDCQAGSLGNGICRTDQLDRRGFRPSTEDLGGLLSWNTKVSSATQVSFLSILSRKNQVRSWEAGSITLDRLNKSDALAASQISSADPNAELRSQIFAGDLTGAEVRDRTTELGHFQAQVTRDFGTSWNWTVQTSYTGQSVQETATSGNVNRAMLMNQYRTGGFSLSDVNSLDGAFLTSLTNPTRRYQGDMINTRLVTGGELGSWLGATMALAVGADFELETMRYNHDAEIVRGESSVFNQQPNVEGQRQVVSSFLEWTAIRNNFELQLAGRFDNYDQFGTTVNPKVGMRYQPSRQWMFRGSYATGFKPPGLVDMFTPAEQRVDRFIDTVQCSRNGIAAGDCRSSSQIVTVNPNPEASFETSVSTSVGMVFQPNDAFDVTLDQWNFAGEGTISNFLARDMIRFEEESGGDVSALNRLGGSLVRDPETGQILQMTVPNVYNRSAKWLSGVDIGMNYRKDLVRGFRLRASTNTSHIFDRRERSFDFSPVRVDPLYGTQNLTSLQLSKGASRGILQVRTLLNGTDDSAFDGWNFPPYTEFDVVFGTSLGRLGDITVALRNVLDSIPSTPPERDLVLVSQNASVTSPLGRRLFLSYSANF